MRGLGVFTGSGLRIAMSIAVVACVGHAVSELLVLRGRAPDLLQRLELSALDVKLARRGPRPPAEWKIAVAAADEKAVQELGSLPWSRAVHAKLVERLTAQGARAIAFDMTFDRPATQAVRDTGRQVVEVLDGAGLDDLPRRLEDSARSVELVAGELGRLRPKKLEALVHRHVEPLTKVANDVRHAKQGIERVVRAVSAPAPMEAFDPDAALTSATRASGRVVFGVISLSELEAQSLGVDSPVLSRSLHAVRSSTITELLVPGPGGAVAIESGREPFEHGLYRRFFGVTAPFEALARATPNFGTLNAIPDDDGVYRRLPLVSGVKGAGLLLPTLALKAVEVALGEPIQIVGRLDDPSPEAILIGDRRIDTELAGAVTLDWYGRFSPAEMPIFSIADLIAGRIERKDVEGKIVFVAATAVGTHDQRVTPLASVVPGVYIHATLAQNLLDGRRLSRPRHVIVLEMLILIAIGAIIGGGMARLAVPKQIGAALALALTWIFFDAMVLFEAGLVVHTVLPVLQIFVSLLAISLHRFLVEQRERENTRRAFSRYLAPAVMEQVLREPEEYLKLGGRRYDATVLFSDIRGFTTISESLSPEALGMLLNRYMTPMTQIVFRHAGTLDKYIGDAVMAFWGAPLRQPDHALRACRAALEMIASLRELNEVFDAAGLPRISIGIGVSTGPMTIGNMGSDEHLSYTALGDRVNLGSRLEGQTRDYGVDILIADATYEAVKSEMLCRELGALRVKGKHEPVRIFHLIGLRADHAAHVAFVEAFEAGLSAFRSRRWDEAVEQFTHARARAGVGGDKCADQYIALCMELKENPPPVDWDGVRVALSK